MASPCHEVRILVRDDRIQRFSDGQRFKGDEKFGILRITIDYQILMQLRFASPERHKIPQDSNMLQERQMSRCPDSKKMPQDSKTLLRCQGFRQNLARQSSTFWSNFLESHEFHIPMSSQHVEDSPTPVKKSKRLLIINKLVE